MDLNRLLGLAYCSKTSLFRHTMRYLGTVGSIINDQLIRTLDLMVVKDKTGYEANKKSRTYGTSEIA